MHINILDTNFQAITIVDIFESLIWTDRYNIFGDFELYTIVNKNLLENIQEDFYVQFEQSAHTMIIDEREIKSDVDEGAHLLIRGQSLESILNRWIVWNQTILSGNFQEEIHRLLNENIINPAITDRRLSNFIFEYSTDPRITNLTINMQTTGDYIYDVIRELCEERNLGFKIILNSKNQFVFNFYMGQDRSYSQEENSYVVFSPEFENIINSNYFESKRTLKNVALVAGEGEGIDRRRYVVGSGSGLNRRELYVDARDISSNVEGGTLSNIEYDAQLEQRGKEKLTENIFIETFEGDVETSQTFIYDQDFFLGDIIQIENEFGIKSSSKIIEIVFSSNKEGETIVPTFSVIT